MRLHHHRHHHLAVALLLVNSGLSGDRQKDHRTSLQCSMICVLPPITMARVGLEHLQHYRMLRRQFPVRRCCSHLSLSCHCFQLALLYPYSKAKRPHSLAMRLMGTPFLQNRRSHQGLPRLLRYFHQDAVVEVIPSSEKQRRLQSSRNHRHLLRHQPCCHRGYLLLVVVLVCAWAHLRRRQNHRHRQHFHPARQLPFQSLQNRLLLNFAR
mmetsp:Transcript_26035/g.72640  ORF Transcript_26035/g.72640 Transcript_26035/m.72640 type:complete len:210 (-) Transcript_26035:1376-2005(-)